MHAGDMPSEHNWLIIGVVFMVAFSMRVTATNEGVSWPSI